MRNLLRNLLRKCNPKSSLRGIPQVLGLLWIGLVLGGLLSRATAEKLEGLHYLETLNRTFNTAYPHPDGTWPAGMSDLEKQPLPEESIRKIYWDNAAPVFGVA